MASSLWNLVDNLPEGIQKIKCKDANDNLIKHKCLSRNKNYSKKIDEELKNWFKNTFKFSNDINRFILLVRKGVYPSKFMNGWKKFHETSLPEKEEVT